MHNYIFGFDIAVDDVERVDLVDSLADLFHDEGDLGFREGLILLEVLVELPSGAHLQDDVDVCGVIQVAVHLDDVRVIQEHLNLELAHELLGQLLLVQQLLLYYL